VIRLNSQTGKSTPRRRPLGKQPAGSRIMDAHNDTGKNMVAATPPGQEHA
jgi:hypothetical protein